MSTESIEEFGEQIVRRIRDESISSCNAILKPDRQTKDALRWRAAAAARGQVPANMVIPEPVDAVVANLALAIDHSLIRVSFTTKRGEFVYLPDVGGGEMSGWCGGAGGWRTWYSKERIVDAADFAHIAVEYGVGDLADDPPPNLDELPMPERAVQEFAELLMRHVRDVAIQSCDMQLLPHSQTAVAKRWRRAAIPFNGQVPPQVLIPDCVDEAIYAFLRAIDQGLLPLSYVSENGETVDLVKEGRGELAARYMAADGWRAKYSKERINEDVEE